MYGFGVMLTIPTSKLHPSIQIVLRVIFSIIFYVCIYYMQKSGKKTLVKIETQEKDAMCKNVTALRDTEKVLFCGLTE